MSSLKVVIYNTGLTAHQLTQEEHHKLSLLLRNDAHAEGIWTGNKLAMVRRKLGTINTDGPMQAPILNLLNLIAGAQARGQDVTWETQYIQ